MNTQELIARLPDTIKGKVKKYKDEYKEHPERIIEVRQNINGYCHGLADAGVLSSYERQLLYTYMTL